MGRVAVVQRAGRSAETISLWHRSVKRAIELMRSRLGDELSLEELAKAAAMSEFHFDRVFRQITGVSPFTFLSALRLARARDRLIDSSDSIIDICLSVGYRSLGTFTRRFTALVGASPRRVRDLAQQHPLAVPAAAPEPDRDGGQIVVAIERALEGCVVFVGAFATPIPVGRPLACAIGCGACELRLSGLPSGRHHVLAVALRADRLERLDQDILVAAAAENPLQVSSSAGAPRVCLALRRPEITDPPILSFLPWLLQGQDGPAAATLRAAAH